MNHPQHENWVPFLYGEMKPDLQRQLRAHLEVCAECREEVDNWKRSLRRLDAWKLPRSRKPDDLFVPILKWAAAAMLVLGLGFGVGRISAAGSDAAKDRAALKLQLKQELQQELAQFVRDEMRRATPATLATARSEANKLLAAYATSLEAQRDTDTQTIRTALDRLELQNISLKKELDTVAVNTDVGLQQTEQQLAQLAVYKQPGNVSQQQK
ncbi:MAG TPA: anti-sigma factor [Candidatus Acidoferrum sp.]|jgi:hypothetical protein|nr:anti-sigma factor [Candidatus Acidoferrum sp.]